VEGLVVLAILMAFVVYAVRKPTPMSEPWPRQDGRWPSCRDCITVLQGTAFAVKPPVPLGQRSGFGGSWAFRHTPRWVAQPEDTSETPTATAPASVW